MLNQEKTDDWVFGSYSQHSTYFWMMSHYFDPRHVVLVHWLQIKCLLWMGLVAGQRRQLSVDPCQTSLDKPEDLTNLISHRWPCAILLSIIYQPHTELWECRTTCLEVSKVCLWTIRNVFSFAEGENKIDEAMQGVSDSTQAESWIHSLVAHLH